MHLPSRHSRARPARRRTARTLPLLLCLLILAGGIVLLDATRAAADGSSWRWPLQDDHAVLNDFAPPASPWGRGHRGIDLAADPGEPVVAAGDGRVRYAGMLAGRGVVSIVHGERRTTYEPVVPSVRAGDTVDAGDRIGVIGHFGSHCAAACLHWGLLRGDEYLHPLKLLGRGPVRLLPVWDVPPPGGVSLSGIWTGAVHDAPGIGTPGSPEPPHGREPPGG